MVPYVVLHPLRGAMRIWSSANEGRGMDKGCYLACLMASIGLGMVLSGLALYLVGLLSALGPPGSGEGLRIAGAAVATSGAAILVAVFVLSWKNRVR